MGSDRFHYRQEPQEVSPSEVSKNKRRSRREKNKWAKKWKQGVLLEDDENFEVEIDTEENV